MPFDVRSLTEIRVPHLKEYLIKAGLDMEPKRIQKLIQRYALILNFVLSAYLVYWLAVIRGKGLGILFIFIPLFVVLGFLAIVFLLWMLFSIYIDFRIKAKSMPKKKKVKEQISETQQKRRYSEYLSKSGLDLHLPQVAGKIFKAAIVLNLIINGYLLYTYSNFRPGVLYTLVTTSVLWTLGFMLLVLFMWIGFFIWIDLRIYERTKKIEEVLPEFLHLTSANISAGMPIDRAMWFAVRPRFGVLAKEIEEVAKSTLVGEKLENALTEFANKYDSEILKRSISLLLEGLESGGEIGDLLNRIAGNIEETRIIRKEMAASVTTYVIFIGFASIVAAPFLFGLSTELIVIMQTIISKIDLGSVSSGGGMMFSISGDSIALADYQTFVLLCMSVTSFFSAVIINIISKGSVREGIYLIPVFILASMIIYYASYSFMHMLLGGFFV